MNDKDMNGGEKTMKSNRKKRIIAAVLCMVMVLSSSISALAGEEMFVDITEASEEFSSEPMVVTETEPAGEAFTETEASPEISFSDGDVTADVETEAPVDPETPAEPAPEVPEETPSEEAVPETPADEIPAEEENFADFGDGMSDSVADTQILSEETELKQEFVDEAGNVVQRVTAKLPAGAFAAETSSVTMEVSYLDADSEKYLKSMMNENIPEGMQLGSYVFFNVQFKVNGEKAEALKPVEITIEGSGLTITDIKKTNVFYFDPADPSVEGDKDELKEIPQRSEVLESLQSAGQSTENIEDYDLSEITFREDGTTDKVIFEGRKSTIYGCYTEEAKPEEVPAEPTPVPEEITPIPEEPAPEEPGTAEEPETEEPVPETASEIEIISDEVNLRTEPNAEADNVAAAAYTGERFPLLENIQVGETLWYKIQYTYSETGETAELYVRSDFAKVVDEAASDITDDEAVDMIPVDPVKTLNYSDDQVDVSVSAYQENVIPENAELQVTPITADSEGYADVEQKVQEKVAEEEKEVAGFLAYDITLVDPEGNKLEPNGEVKVSMNYKPAAIPETVQETGAENTEVSVLHLEENAAGEVQQVVDMTSENQVETLNTTETNEIQTVEMTTESFSVFTITWKYSRWSQFTITAKYVDLSGNEINVAEPPSQNIEINEDNPIDLTEYWREAEGYRQVKITADNVDGTEIENLKAYSESKGALFWEWTEYYIKYKTKDNRDYQNWLQFNVDSSHENDKTTGTIYFVYEKEDTSLVKIADNIISDGSLTAVLKEENPPEGITYQWSKSNDKNGHYTEVEKRNFNNGESNLSEDGSKLYPAYDEGARKWYKVKVTYPDRTEKESVPFQVPYYNELKNGSFEIPDVGSDSNGLKSNNQWSNEEYVEGGGVWKSTGTGTSDTGHSVSIEIVQQKGRGGKDSYTWEGDWNSAAVDGKQFAEINCQNPGALYQDVLTIAGEPLNFWLSHRARGTTISNDSDELDTMYLVIMPSEAAKDLQSQAQLKDALMDYDVDIDSPQNNEVGFYELYNHDGIYIAEITSDDKHWHEILSEGVQKYVPTAALTRFFFVSGKTASGINTVGNFIDKVGFSQDLPPVEEGKFNFTIKKNFTGLGNEQLKEMQEKLQFKITAKNSGDPLSGSEIRELLGISEEQDFTIENDHIIMKASAMKADVSGNLAISFAQRSIVTTGSVYTFTVEEMERNLDGYTVTTQSKVTVKQDQEEGEPVETEEVTADVSNVKGKTEATVEFTNNYRGDNFKNVNFTKVWDDGGDKFSTRPESLEVTLQAAVNYVNESGETVTKELTGEELGVTPTATLTGENKWTASWKVPVYYKTETDAKVLIHYSVSEGSIGGHYVYTAGPLQKGNADDYNTYTDFPNDLISGEGSAVTTGADSSRRMMSAGSGLNAVQSSGEDIGEPSHKKYITYNESTGDYTLNLDVTGKKGEAEGVDVLFVIDTSGSMAGDRYGRNGLLSQVKNLLAKDNNNAVDQILGGEGNVNSAAFVSFAGKNETRTSSWYESSTKEYLKSGINSLRATGGTNWTYAMMKAADMLQARFNSGNDKVVIFLSDGEPTYSINSRNQEYGYGNRTIEQYYTDAISKVKSSQALKSAKMFSVYLTPETQEGMEKFAEGTGAELINGVDLYVALTDILKRIIPTYENVSIQDTLSQYVEFAEGSVPTVRVTKKTASGTEALQEGSHYQLERKEKTVKVTFTGDLDDAATYTVSFRIKPSQKANEEFSKNGYPHTGEPETGATSAGKQGFYSNDSADLTYSIKGTDKKGLTAEYPQPVVQVTTHSLTFLKKWSGVPYDVERPKSVSLNVMYTDGSKETIELSEGKGWTLTKTNVPVTKKIQSITEQHLDDYTPSYEIAADGTAATVTNSYSRITTKNIKVVKEWIGEGPQPEIKVSLYYSDSGNNAEKLHETVVLNASNHWTYEWTKLPDTGSRVYGVREEAIPANYTSNITYTTEGDTTTAEISNVYDQNCTDESYYIVNTLQTVPLTITKTWNDDDNSQGERPATLGVTVQEGDHKLLFTLSGKGNVWTESAARMLKRKDNTYTATEDLEGFKQYKQTDESVSTVGNKVNVSFTNQITTKTITVKKVWIDTFTDDKDRPGSIHFKLFRNGKEYETYSLSAEDMDKSGNTWTKVIENLPVTGTYTVEEYQEEGDPEYDYISTVTTNEQGNFIITNKINWHIVKTSETLGGAEAVPLGGAEFQLKKDNEVIASGTSGEDGMIAWKPQSDIDLTKLSGDYMLVETKAPSGYVVHSDGWKVTFDQDGLLTKAEDLSDSSKQLQISSTKENGIRLTVTNQKLYTLPSTGGNGIYVYMIGGVALMMAAMFILYKMKCKGVRDS